MTNLNLLKKICLTPGAPGYEQKIRELVIQEVTPLVDEVSIDAMGSVTALKRGKGNKKIMCAAHIDEIGFMVTHINKNGFIRFDTLGGFDAKTLTSQRVIIHGKKDIIGVMGCKPVHLMKAEERGKPLPATEYFIDTGMKKEEVAKYISVGNSITRERELIEMGECVNSKSLDNRVSVFILIEMFREMQKKPPYDVYGEFTVQEEIGIRGANVSSMEINPDFGFGLDTTIAWDTPGSTKQEQVSALGEGACIKVIVVSKKKPKSGFISIEETLAPLIPISSLPKHLVVDTP